jgi:Protein of unknown function (DUF2905)
MGDAMVWPSGADRRALGLMPELGRALIVMGIVLAVVGLVLVFVDRVPWIGRLPGDVHVQRGNWTIYVPLGTSIVLSVVLTLVLWLIGRR